MHFQWFACSDNVVFQTDMNLAIDLDVYSMLFPEDNLRFTGFSEGATKIPNFPLFHNVALNNDKNVHFFFKVDEDTKQIQTIVEHLELYQKNTKQERIGTLLAEKNQLPTLPALFEKKKKKKHSKKKKHPKKEEEEEKPVVKTENDPKEEEEEGVVLIKSNEYNGLFVDEYWLKTCGAIQPMCGKCDISNKEKKLCFDCSMYVYLADRIDSFFKGCTTEYKQVDVEHPFLFQSLFYSLFRYRTRSPRFQIVIAYSVLEVIMELIANPDQKNIGHTKEWYKRAYKDRLDAFRDIVNHEKFHPLQLKVTDSMSVRFQKLEEHVYNKFKIFVEKSNHVESRFIASRPYSEIRDRRFASAPAPYNNKISEMEFTKRIGLDGNLKIVPQNNNNNS